MTLFDETKEAIRTLGNHKLTWMDSSGTAECYVPFPYRLSKGAQACLMHAIHHLNFGTSLAPNTSILIDEEYRPRSIVIASDGKDTMETLPTAVLNLMVDRTQRQIAKGWSLADDGSGDAIRPILAHDSRNLDGSASTILFDIIQTLEQEPAPEAVAKSAEEYTPAIFLEGAHIRIKAERITDIEEALGISITGQARSVA